MSHHHPSSVYSDNCKQQSEKRGGGRPPPGSTAVAYDEVLDSFVQEILLTCIHISRPDKYQAMYTCMAEKGRECSGELSVHSGGDYA